MANLDVLIVGAGVTGAATGYHLLNMNPRLTVAIIDKHDGPCQGNSGKSAAKVRDTVTSEVNLALCRSSIAAYREFQAEEDIGLNLMGYLWLMSDEQKAKNARAIEVMRHNGVRFRLIDSHELADLLPQLNQTIDPDELGGVPLPNARGGLLGLDCGSVEPDRLVAFYLSRFKQSGGTVTYDRKVERLVFDMNSDFDELPLLRTNEHVYGVRLSNGEVMYAEKVLLATNADSFQLLESTHGLRSHVLPKKRQLYEASVPGFGEVKGFKVEEGRDFGFPFTILPWKGIYIWQQSPGVMGIGCADQVDRPFKFEDDPQPEPGYFTDQVLPIIAQYFPAFQGASRGHAAAGMYDYSDDGVPNIDEILTGLYLSNGASGRGIMVADAVGRITAAKLLGHPTADLHNGATFEVSRLSVQPHVRNVDVEEFRI
jgi:glycine/D-amino acid oxidase-like deaminating enzyme